MQSGIKKICFVLAFFSTPVPVLPVNADTGENLAKTISFVEIMPNPEGTDTKENEYFKLKDNSNNLQSLGNWKVCNINNDCYVFKEETILDGCLKIFRTDFIFTLHNDKEELSLYDPDNNLIDKVTTASAPSGKTWLCLGNSCEWGEMRDNCDYSSPEDNSLPDNVSVNSQLSTTESQNMNDNSESAESQNNQNDNKQEIKNNTNTNANNQTIGNKNKNNSIKNSNTNSNSKKSVSILEIESAKDLKKAAKKIEIENLASVKANIEGKVVVPRNVIGKNIFYVFSNKKLIKAEIYSSNLLYCRNDTCLASADKFKENQLVEIQNGYLKYKNRQWQIGLGKETGVSIAKKNSNAPKNNSGIIPASKKINAKKLGSQEGKIIIISGEILSKNGSYFFIQDKRSKNPLLVYFPPNLWSLYQQKEAKLKKNDSAFPVFLKPQKSVRYKGSLLEARGVIETVGKDYRIIINSLSDFKISQPAVAEEKKETKKNGEELVETQKEAEKTSQEKESSEKIPAPEVSNNKSEENNNKHVTEANDGQKDKLNQIQNVLAQKLTWKSVWDILAKKIKYNVKELF